MALCLPLKLPNSSSNKFRCNRLRSFRILSSLRLDIYRVIKISFLFQRGFKFRYIDLIDNNNLQDYCNLLSNKQLFPVTVGSKIELPLSC